MKIHGEKKTKRNNVFYTAGHKYRTGDWAGKFCAGYANIIFGGDHDDDCESCAWGYYGEGPKRTAALALLYYLRGVDSPGDDGWSLDGMPPTEEELNFIFRHLDKFTLEIIAKLPDDWTLTYEEIKVWLDKQPKENENQTRPDHAAETGVDERQEETKTG